MRMSVRSLPSCLPSPLRRWPEGCSDQRPGHPGPRSRSTTEPSRRRWPPSSRSTPRKSSPTAWSTAPSTACSRRSIRTRASWTRAATRRCGSGRKGRYYGLGVTIQAPNGDITAVRVFEGSPAHDKGIRRGDVIAEIEGQSTKGWTTDDAVAKLRGPKGTFVNIGIRRKGLEPLIPMRRDARSGQHPEPVGGVHDRRRDRLRRHHRLRRAHRRGSRRPRSNR